MMKQEAREIVGVSESSLFAHDSGSRRLTVRRGVLLTVTLLAVSGTVCALGAAYLWPLFIFPLFLAAVFFFELGSLLVSSWLVAFFVVYYGLIERLTPAAVVQAAVGTSLFTVAGLLLGRVQRRHHRDQKLLAASSLTDRLTGLYNYGTFVDYLHNEVTKTNRYGGDLTLIMLDLDRFKDFNDRHGHETGNQLLRQVGATLRATVREADMAARYGGEEFAVLIRGDETRGYELAERLRRAIEKAGVTLRGGAEVFTTVSAGVASYPSGASDETQIVEHADASLYESKRRGRNRVTVYTRETDGDLAATLSA
jgi:diguanylate cyclase (GGDEF)-like protein